MPKKCCRKPDIAHPSGCPINRIRTFVKGSVLLLRHFIILSFSAPASLPKFQSPSFLKQLSGRSTGIGLSLAFFASGSRQQFRFRLLASNCRQSPEPTICLLARAKAFVLEIWSLGFFLGSGFGFWSFDPWDGLGRPMGRPRSPKSPMFTGLGTTVRLQHTTSPPPPRPTLVPPASPLPGLGQVLK